MLTASLFINLVNKILGLFGQQVLSKQCIALKALMTLDPPVQLYTVQNVLEEHHYTKIDFSFAFQLKNN